MSAIGNLVHEEFTFIQAGFQVIFFEPLQHRFYTARCSSSSVSVMIVLTIVHFVLGISASICPLCAAILLGLMQY